MITLFSVFAVTVFLGVPVAFCLGLGFLGFILLDPSTSLSIVPTLFFGGIDSFALLAIPLFVLAGFLVRESGVLGQLVDLAESMVGHIRGGLALVNVIVSMLFAGVSGVALADTAAVGSMLIPPMIEEGYDRKFSAVVTASSSIVGPIIPPSVAMIIYAFTAGGMSVAGLFMAGMVPGIIVGLGFMALSYYISVKRGYPLIHDNFSIMRMLRSARGAILGLLVPVIILGGIVSGMFTPTEAGGIAVAYALLVGLIVTRELTFSKIYKCFLDTAKTSATVFVMLATARVVAWILTANQVPQQLANMLLSVTENPQIFLILSLTFLLFLGFVLEAVATLVMLVPILAPVAAQFGVNPYHFGLLFVMTIQIALITPPVALGLFVVTNLADTSIEEVMSDVWPYLAVGFGLILFIALFPQISLFVPRLLGFF